MSILVAQVVHDYLAAFLTLVWLIGFRSPQNTRHSRSLQLRVMVSVSTGHGFSCSYVRQIAWN